MKKQILASLYICALSGSCIAAEEWTAIGQGEYTDDIIASCFKNVSSQTMKVDFERNVANPNLYRIVNPYANWENKFKKNFFYDESKDHYLEFEVINDEYVYIHPFSTGYTYEDPTGGEVTVRNQANHQVEDNGYTLQEVAEEFPTSLARYNSGYITYPAKFILDGQGYDNIIVYYSRSSTWYVGNRHENFAMRMPGAVPPDPNEGWVSLGMGKITDDVFATLYENLPQQIWEVEIQRSVDNPDIFRVVSPYKGWKDPGNLNLSYSESKNDYMIIHTEHAPHAWFENFPTGYTYNVQGGGEITVGMQATTAINQYGYEAVASEFSDEIFGRFENNVFTVPNELFMVGSEPYDVMLAFIGQSYLPVNMHRNFTVTIPDPASVEELASDKEESRFYTLSGFPVTNPASGSIVIERKGSRARKLMIK